MRMKRAIVGLILTGVVSMHGQALPSKHGPHVRAHNGGLRWMWVEKDEDRLDLVIAESELAGNWSNVLLDGAYLPEPEEIQRIELYDGGGDVPLPAPEIVFAGGAGGPLPLPEILILLAAGGGETPEPFPLDC